MRQISYSCVKDRTIIYTSYPCKGEDTGQKSSALGVEDISESDVLNVHLYSSGSDNCGPGAVKETVLEDKVLEQE